MSFKRLTKSEYICYLALASSSRSEDEKTQVGSVIVNKDWRVLNTAFNGWKAGMPTPDKYLLEENRLEKNEFIIHAEDNLFNFYHDKPFAIGLTISPCARCSKTIVAHGIKEVYYIKEYWRDTAKEFTKIFNFYDIKYQCLSKESLENIANMMYGHLLDLNEHIKINLS